MWGRSSDSEPTSACPSPTERLVVRYAHRPYYDVLQRPRRETGAILEMERCRCVQQRERWTVVFANARN